MTYQTRGHSAAKALGDALDHVFAGNAADLDAELLGDRVGARFGGALGDFNRLTNLERVELVGQRAAAAAAAAVSHHRATGRRRGARSGRPRFLDGAQVNHLNRVTWTAVQAAENRRFNRDAQGTGRGLDCPQHPRGRQRRAANLLVDRLITVGDADGVAGLDVERLAGTLVGPALSFGFANEELHGCIIR